MKDRSRRMGARQIYEAIRQQIADGAFGTDGLLPSSRNLALELGVSRTTVTIAYDQLLAEGFIEVRQGARPRVIQAAANRDGRKRPRTRSRPARLSAYGERIRKVAPWRSYAPSDAELDFRYGDLAAADFPAAIWKRAMNAAMGERSGRLAYDDPRGSRRLRMALQGYLWRARTLRCDLDQIVVVNGSQQGLDLCARLLLDAGDRFVIEDPCYVMARRIFSGVGATAVAVAVDGDGLDTAQLSGVEARLAYVTPSHQFPLGGVMPVSRRLQLVEWAQRNDAYVIEDDYDSEYRYDISPVPPLHGLEDCGSVIYLGTISKTLSPMLRIGYLVVPPDLQDVFATAKQLTDRHSPITEQEALAFLIENGGYESHVRRVRRLNDERRETLLTALRHRFADTIVVQGADAGLHVVIWLTELPRSAEGELVSQARQRGVGLHPVSALYSPDRDGPPADRVGLVMGYSALETRQIERGVHVLAEVVEEMKSRRPKPTR